MLGYHDRSDSKRDWIDPASGALLTDDPEHLHELIEKTAYSIAEGNGFPPGHELDDWLSAEALVCAALGFCVPHRFIDERVDGEVGA